MQFKIALSVVRKSKGGTAKKSRKTAKTPQKTTQKNETPVKETIESSVNITYVSIKSCLNQQYSKNEMVLGRRGKGRRKRGVKNKEEEEGRRKRRRRGSRINSFSKSANKKIYEMITCFYCCQRIFFPETKRIVLKSGLLTL